MITLKPLNRAEATRYLGGRGKAPDAAMTALFDECEKKLISAAAPKYLYRVLPLPNDEITRGGDIRSHLSGCQSAVVMCATLGGGVDRLLRIAQISDMAEAVVLDALASTAIEQVCGEVDMIIADLYPEMHPTFRFSPGYGDYPLEMQRTLLDLLDAQRKIGLTLNESLLMIPSKSVTAVMGLSGSPVEQKKRGCAACNLRESCRFRKQGEHCGF